MRSLRASILPLLTASTLFAGVACGGADDAAVPYDIDGPDEGKGGAISKGGGAGATAKGGATAAGSGGAAASSGGGTSAGGTSAGGTSAQAGSGQGGTSAAGAGGSAGGATAGSGGASGSGPSSVCASPPGKPGSQALVFDGVDDHVTMGNVKALGLGTFTVEAWIRRDGTGKEMSTGVGGLGLVPIAGKGRGESDGTTVDCNYAFGFVGERIAVDFEDLDDGDNHPLVGNQIIPRKEWHHVATTFDGKTLALYVDGVLDATLPTTAKPRADSVQHFGIGAGLDSKGVAAGAFHGAIDDVRVWSSARTAAQISASAFVTLPATPGLLATWSFEDGTAKDSAGGTITGTLKGPQTTSPGSPIDTGRAPTVVSGAPANNAVLAPPAADLTVSFDDADSAAFDSQFYLRTLTDADDFTIVVLPDTQYYTEEHNDWRKHFYAQTKWIVDNRKAYNIVGVIHNGDITDTGQKNESEWKVADKAMSALEDQATTGLTDGIPYAVTIGNHDNRNLAGDSVTGNTGYFNQYFGIGRFSGRAYYGGHYGSKKNDENYVTFTAGGLDLVVVNYQFIDDDTAYRKAVLNWGRAVFDGHPDAFGIANSHGIIKSGAVWLPQGQAIYDSLATAKNVHLMTCGHISDEERRTDTKDGHSIVTMLADYQSLGKTSDPNNDVPSYEGGSGYLRIWEFSPKNGELTVRTYSPSLKKWQTDPASEFTLKVPLTGAGGAWTKLGAGTMNGKTAKIDVGTLAPGGVYEWYATVSDCNHTVASPVYRFSAAK